VGPDERLGQRDEMASHLEGVRDDPLLVAVGRHDGLGGATAVLRGSATYVLEVAVLVGSNSKLLLPSRSEFVGARGVALRSLCSPTDRGSRAGRERLWDSGSLNREAKLSSVGFSQTLSTTAEADVR